MLRLNPTIHLTFLLVLTCLVRLLASIFANDIIDVRNYQQVAEVIDRFGVSGLYRYTPDIYPYPPLWAGFEVAAHWLARHNILSFSLAIRLPIIAADAGIVAVIWQWVHRRSGSSRQAMQAAMIYALNPVSIIVSCWHGQFDALPLFWAVLAMICTAWQWQAIALSIGIALKSFPVLLVPAFLWHLQPLRRRVQFGLLALVPVLLLLAPFVIYDAFAVVRELFGYRGHALLGIMVPVRTVYVPLVGERFPVETTRLLISLSAYGFLLLYALTVWSMKRRSMSVPMQATLIVLLFYVVYAGIAPQYLLWALPFMIMAARPGAVLVYSAVSTLALLGFYLYAVPDIFPFALAVSPRLAQVAYGLFGSLWWLTCGGLLVWFWRQR